MRQVDQSAGLSSDEKQVKKLELDLDHPPHPAPHLHLSSWISPVMSDTQEKNWRGNWLPSWNQTEEGLLLCSLHCFLPVVD